MNNIKFYRNKANMSQNELAKMMNSKQTTISNWELDYRKPNVYETIKLAKILNTTVEELYK